MTHGRTKTKHTHKKLHGKFGVEGEVPVGWCRRSEEIPDDTRCRVLVATGSGRERRAEVIREQGNGTLAAETQALRFPSFHLHGAAEPEEPVSAVFLRDVPSSVTEPTQPRFLLASSGGTRGMTETIRFGVHPDYGSAESSKSRFDNLRVQEERLSRGQQQEDFRQDALKAILLFGTSVCGPSSKDQASLTPVRGIYFVGGAEKEGTGTSLSELSPNRKAYVLGSGGRLEEKPFKPMDGRAFKKQTRWRQVRELPDLIYRRCLAGCAVMDGALWVVGGLGKHGRVRRSVEFLPLLNKDPQGLNKLAWQDGPTLPFHIFNAAVSRFKGMEVSAREMVEVLDGGTGSWEGLAVVGGATTLDSSQADSQGTTKCLLLVPCPGTPTGWAWFDGGDISCRRRCAKLLETAPVLEWPPAEVGAGMRRCPGTRLLCVGGQGSAEAGQRLEFLDLSGLRHPTQPPPDGQLLPLAQGMTWKTLPLRLRHPCLNGAALALPEP